MLKNIYMDIKGFYIKWLGEKYYLKDFKKVLTNKIVCDIIRE